MSKPRLRAPAGANTWWRLGIVLAALAGVNGWGACSLHQEGVRPPDNRIFFPGGAALEKGGRWLYVINSNSDLRYNSGTLAAVDLHKVRRDDPRDATLGMNSHWDVCPADSRYVPPANVAAASRCCWDNLDPVILNCDEQKYFETDDANSGAAKSTVRIGSFGGRPAMQQFPDGGRRRLFIPVRGDTSIGMVDVEVADDKVNFHCTGSRAYGASPSVAPSPFDVPQPDFALCDAQWRISRQDDPVSMPLEIEPLPDDQVVRIPDEPYALAVDESLQLLYVGHLRGGNVSLIDLGTKPDVKTPELLQVFAGLLPPDANGSQGITSLTIKQPGCFGAVYATSRFNPVVSSFVVYGVDCAPKTDAQSNRGVAVVGTGEVVGTGLSGGAETRGIEFVRTRAGANPDRAFVLQRTPPTLVGIDTATLQPFAALEVCQGPTNLQQEVDAAGRTISLFITCYDAGEIYVVDPWVPRIRTIIPVGRGPIDTVLPPSLVDDPADANRAYVIGFGGNNVMVLDLDPNSPNRYRVIQRIGFSSPTPREVGSP